jgi:hypothetical protein
MVAVCDTCLLEDYGTEPTLFRSLQDTAKAVGHILNTSPSTAGSMLKSAALPYWEYITNPEVRLILAIRADFLALSKRVRALSVTEIERQIATSLSDVDELTRAGAEIDRIDNPQMLRQEATQTFLNALQVSLAPPKEMSISTALKRKGRDFILKNKFDSTNLPELLRRRINESWFDFLRLAFREVLKEYPKALTAFEIDALSRLSETVPRSFSTIEKRLNQHDEKLDAALKLLRQIHTKFNLDGKNRAKNRKQLKRAFLRHQQEFRGALNEW